MFVKVFEWIKKVERWQVIVVSLIVAEIPAMFVVLIMTTLSIRVPEYDYLTTGALASFVIAIFAGLILAAFVLELRRMEAAKREFISITAHQLRGPLTSIQWAIELFLNKEKMEDRVRAEFDSVQHSLKHLDILLDILLNVYRIEEGKLNISTRPADIVKIVKGYIIEEKPIIEKKTLKFELKDAPESLMAVTDTSAVTNIIQSLISNAIDYTPDGGRIEVFLEKKNATFVFKVSDTGIGIPQNEQPRMFEKFYRASNARAVKSQGTGLGLYIAKQAAKLLGGKIWFESEEGRGATFFVELPLENKN